MAKAKTKKNSKGKKQGVLVGMGRKTIAAIDAAALQYVEKRDERMAATVHEVESKELLLRVMKQHKKEIYKFVDGEKEFTVSVVVSSEKPKVESKSLDAEG